ncbi:hypothetical protein NMY22_g18695 [Coprinellus aureogranulatus]|nr:hypothetical protein NMY22_g18695 [Coprinellus aureogranulatus]
MSNFKSYTTPSPTLCFSKEYFASLTLEQAAYLSDIPRITAPQSVYGWTWSKEQPTNPQAMSIMPGEIIPAREDLATIIANLQGAYLNGYRSVLVNFRVDGQSYTFLYHLSKIELIKLVNNYDVPRRGVWRLLEHLKTLSSHSLTSGVLDEFKQCKFLSKLTGFYSTNCALYQLCCLLGEMWVEEDILCALQELEYFRKHADSVHRDPSLAGTAPSHIILPTDFLSDAVQPLWSEKCTSKDERS